MENKILYTLNIGTKIDSLKIEDRGFEITYGETTTKINTHHECDCCEDAWGDFDAMNSYKEKIAGDKVESLILNGVEGMGFLLHFKESYGGEKIFIPCYSSNNGYYSDNLSLQIKTGETITSIDIRNLHDEQ